MRRGEERRGERRREERGGGREERRGGGREREGGREGERGRSEQRESQGRERERVERVEREERERGEPLSLGTSQAVELALAAALAVDLALAPALAGGHAICTGAKGRRTDLTRRRWGEGSHAGFPCVSARVTPRGLKMSGTRRGRRGRGEGRAARRGAPPHRPKWRRARRREPSEHVLVSPLCLCVARACRHHLSRVHPYRVGVQSEPGCSSPFYLPTY